MTDTYVEKLIINKFLKLSSLEDIPKCYQYFQNNKESDEPLEAFKVFMPNYPDEATEIDKAKIDSPLLLSFIDWFQNVYPEYYNTPDGTPEDDELFNAIKSTVLSLTTIQRVVKIYNEQGDQEDLLLYPNVAFPNTEFTRPVDKVGNNTYWYELYFIPAPPMQIELGTKGRSRWCGIMQINICIPKTWGTDELYARYDEVAELFKSGLIIEGVRIKRTYRSSAIDDKDFYSLPVTIDWQADLDR